jgi:hypothetical protein
LRIEVGSLPAGRERTVMADEPLETGLIGGVEKREIRIVDYDTE